LASIILISFIFIITLLLKKYLQQGDDSMKLLFAELIISLNMEILVQNILALLT